MALKKIWIDTGKDYSKSRKKYEYGYNEELDIVIISKDGTLGKVVEIDGLEIGLPRQPKKKEMLFHDLPEDKQIWKRTKLPNELYPIGKVGKKPSPNDYYTKYPPEFREQWDPYIDQEWDRRENGIWAMIGGEPIYLTGKNYMFLQWNSLGKKYPAYRLSQMVLWVHWEACVADDRCIGQCYLKNRRSGYSTMNMSDTLEVTSKNEFFESGIMSKVSKDASKMYNRMIIPAFNRYPFFFTPLVPISSKPKTELTFAAPAERMSATNKSVGADEGLESVITWWSTGPNSMDGRAIDKMALDEIGKFPKDVPFDEYWQVAMECLTEGGEITGKVMAGSTANSSKKGGKEFKDIYYESKVEKRDEELGQTPSNMYSLFIPAEYNLSKYIDQFGRPILEDHPDGIRNETGKIVKIGSKTFLKARRARYDNDPAKLNEELRKNPTTEEHAFRDPSSDSNFNLAKIYEQLEYNANLKTSETVRGDFHWLVKDKEVIFTPNPKGKCIVRWLPKVADRNNIEMKNGKPHPGNKMFITGGIDSYDISKTIDNRGSNGSMHLYLKAGFDEDYDSEFILEYVDRPQMAEQFFETCLMIAVYYGAHILIENNKSRILHHWRDRGYRQYAAERPDKSWQRLSRSEKDIGGIPNSSLEVKLWHAESIEMYIEKHVGINRVPEFGTIGDMGKCFMNELLEDWVSFDINDRTEYDRSISSGLALMLANKKEKKKTQASADVKFQYVRKYKVRN